MFRLFNDTVSTAHLHCVGRKARLLYCNCSSAEFNNKSNELQECWRLSSSPDIFGVRVLELDISEGQENEIKFVIQSFSNFRQSRITS
jgi:hypothetical protein